MQALLMKAFFTQSEASQASGRAYMERLKIRSTDRDTPVSKQSALAELAAIREWGVIPATSRFAMLSKIRHPTLIVHGNKDVVVKPINAFLLSGRQPWRTISARGRFSSACEVVSAVTARSAAVRQVNPGGINLVLLEFARG
jgi:pimeloyl-ACP methyl ester carboxylesterase